MCGIFGCILESERAAPIMYEALKRLEYRGYDSVGQATLHEGKIYVKKDRGKILEVHGRMKLDDMPGNIGIGHTRWATHGAPSRENAHPHLDCRERIAVVHNGIIENFMELKQELESRGHKFRSRTDTEVIPHLIEEFAEKGYDLPEAVRLTAKRLVGSYAIAVISVFEPNKIVCARRESPLIIGVGNGGTYCSSDIPAFLPLTNRAIVMEENEVAILTPKSVQLLKVDTWETVQREEIIITWPPEAAEKEGLPHFMLKEIREQPTAIRNALRTQRIYIELMATMLNEAERVFLVACGTSYHACLASSYAFMKLARLPCQAVVASEFNESYRNILDEKTAVLAVSQSGETADTLNALREAEGRGASILSVTNVMGSTITRLSDVYIGQNSGPEIGVAATKTFTAQVSVLIKLAIALARRRKLISEGEAARMEDELMKTPKLVREVIDKQEEKVKAIAKKYKDSKSFCFLGRGVNVATAMEGRLKLLEISYIPSLAYPAGESKHGFIAVVEPGYPVVFIAPKDENHQKVIGNIMEMKARGAEIIAIIEEGDEQIKGMADDYVEVPAGIPSVMTPIVYVVPLQLLAYYIAVERNCDPDRPRNLAKSVTVE
jgi:glucosamine--fructose-6-phosphate aminotransferase (isomerizing)